MARTKTYDLNCSSALESHSDAAAAAMRLRLRAPIQMRIVRAQMRKRNGDRKCSSILWPANAMQPFGLPAALCIGRALTTSKFPNKRSDCSPTVRHLNRHLDRQAHKQTGARTGRQRDGLGLGPAQATRLIIHRNFSETRPRLNLRRLMQTATATTTTSVRLAAQFVPLLHHRTNQL